MKTRFILLLLLLPLASPSLWSQGSPIKPKAKIGLQLNPYYVRAFSPLPGAINQTKVVARMMMGFSGEMYLNDRLGLRTHLMFGRIRSINYPGIVYIKDPYLEEDLVRKQLDFYADLGVSIRGYTKRNRSRTRAFLETGIGNALWLYSESSYPFHSDPMIANKVRKSKLNYEALALQFGGGLAIRFFKVWGVESAIWVRKFILRDGDVYYGLKLGINRYLK